MASVAGQVPRRRTPPWLIPVAGYAISIACLIWVYWGFDWKNELPKLAAVDWRLVTVAAVADLLVYVTQGWRWNMLLKPVGQTSLLRTIQAIYIGLFANEVLPFRSGEVIRCYLQGRWSRIPFSVVLSSAVIERLFDGIWLALGFLAVSFFVPGVPGYLVQGGKILAIVLIFAVVLLSLVMFRKHHAHAAVSGSRWSEALWHVVEGLHAMGNSRWFLAAFGASFLYLSLQIVPIYALMKGYGLNLSVGAAAVSLVILRLGTILPQAPGNVGSFQFFIVVAMQLFGVAKSTATGFATMLFVVITVPLWLGGLLAVLLAGAKIKHLQRVAHETLNGAVTPEEKTY